MPIVDGVAILVERRHERDWSVHQRLKDHELRPQRDTGRGEQRSGRCVHLPHLAAERTRELKQNAA